MKIIKRGLLPEEQVIQRTCGKCKSVLEFSLAEVVKEYSYRNESFSFIICPLCKERVYITAS